MAKKVKVTGLSQEEKDEIKLRRDLGEKDEEILKALAKRRNPSASPHKYLDEFESEVVPLEPVAYVDPKTGKEVVDWQPKKQQRYKTFTGEEIRKHEDIMRGKREKRAEEFGEKYAGKYIPTWKEEKKGGAIGKIRGEARKGAKDWLEFGYATAQTAKQAGKRILYGGHKFKKVGYKWDAQKGEYVAQYSLLKKEPLMKRPPRQLFRAAPTSMVSRSMQRRRVPRTKRIRSRRYRGVTPTYVRVHPDRGMWDYSNYQGTYKPKRVTNIDRASTFMSGGGASNYIGPMGGSRSRRSKKSNNDWFKMFKSNRKVKHANKRYVDRYYKAKKVKRKSGGWGGDKDDWGLS